jgi:hypothetical protein
MPLPRVRLPARAPQASCSVCAPILNIGMGQFLEISGLAALMPKLRRSCGDGPEALGTHNDESQ